MAKIIEILNNTKTQFSFEILPPLKGQKIEELYKNIDPLIEFNPKFINVTYHREQHVYKSKGAGLLERKVIKKRPGTVGICAALMTKYKIETVPHIICGGFSKEETENALIDLNYLGISNILCLRGDPIKTESAFVPEESGHRYASELVTQVMKLKDGHYQDDDVDGTPLDFCVGVAGYPEKHFEAPNMKTDLYYLKKKVEKGAEYIVTQMFFDNSKFFKFVEDCRSIGITVPIIPGLKPMTRKSQLNSLPKNFHTDIPEDLTNELQSVESDKKFREIGIKWCAAQAKELKEKGVPCLHFYSMGKSTAIQEVCQEIF